MKHPKLYMALLIERHNKIFLYLSTMLVATLLLVSPDHASAQTGLRAVGYWEYWSPTFPDPRVKGAIDWNTMTHIIHHQGNPSQTQIVDPAISRVHYWSPGNGTFASYETNQRPLIDSAHAHGRKVLLGLGGTGGTGSNWDWMSANGKMREFVSGISYYCKLRGYDGVDIDWEYPGGGTVFGVSEVSAAYDLLRSLRDTLNTWSTPGTICWAAQPWSANWHLRPDSVQKWASFINVMNYDYQDYGSSVNAHHTALYPYGHTHADTVETTSWQDSLYSTNSPANGWGSTSHYNKSFINVGLGFYGHGRTGNALGVAGTSSGFERYGTCTLGMYNTPGTAYRYHYDNVAQSPYLAWTDASAPGCGFGSTVHFHTFDDTVSIAVKSKWARDLGYGGVMIFDLPGDDGAYSLMRAVKKGLGGGVVVPPPSDVVPPAVAIASPGVGAVVSGALAIVVSASDNVGVTRVDFLVNAKVVATVSSTPFTYDWTTSGLSGAVVLTARAYDLAGNSTLSSPVGVTVSNVASLPVNLALGMPATASSVQTNSSFLPQYAVDGNAMTRWSSQYSDPQWIRVDLGSALKIDSVMIMWEAPAISYEIQTSLDGANWTSGYWTTAGAGGTTQVKLAPVNARYVRMYGTQRATIYGYSTYEVQVFAAGGSTGGSPGAPVLLQPLNGATGVVLNPTLSWSAPNGTSSYRVQVSDSNAFRTFVLNDSTVTTTTRQVTGLALGKSYFWRVNAKNASGTSPWSGVNTFATAALPDTSAPVVTITSPLSGSTLSGTVTVSANASDNTRVTRVDFFLGSTLVVSDTLAPYGFSWNSASVANGAYAFSARGYDPAGNIGTSVSIPVTVSNGGADLSVYRDGALDPPWTNKSTGGTTIVFNSTEQAYQGTSSAKVTQGHWGAANFMNGDWGTLKTIDGTLYRSIDFAIFAPLPLIDLIVGLSGIGTVFHAGPQPGNTWITVSVPMNAMYTTTAFFDRFYISDLNNNATTVFYLDNIRFTRSGSAATAGVDSGYPALGSEHGAPAPDHFDLSQNFPNPFNPTAKISYSLPTEVHVSLKVYNVLGQEVMTLVDGVQSSGYKQVTVDMNKLPSGVYFYRLQAGDFVQMKKMILTR